MRKVKRMATDRMRQVATTKSRYGDNHYEVVGSLSATFKDQAIARKAIWKRWHPDHFDAQGNIKPEFMEEFTNAAERKKR